MPQIWPANWSLLFMFFLVSFIVFLIMLYFTIPIKSNPGINSSSVKVTKLNWLW